MPSSSSSTDTALPDAAFIADELKRFVDTLPHLPGVYRMLGAEQHVLYVGKAKDLYKRVRSYFQSSRQLGPRIQRMVSQIHRIEITVTRSEAEALLLENNLIKALNPRYNIIFRDDKSYAYLCLSAHPFSQMRFHRGTLTAPHRYFGPYPSGLAVKQGMEVLQKVFRLRTCDESVFANRSRPCMLYQIKRCSAPCVGAISKEDYALDVRDAIHFLEGDTKAIVHTLQERMEQAAERMEFEAAALWRDRLKLLQSLGQQQFVNSTESKEQERSVDVFGAVLHESLLAINWVMMRSGRHCGDRTFFPEGKQWTIETDEEFSVNNESDQSSSISEERYLSEACLYFMIQHYSRHPLPDYIVVPITSDMINILQEALQTMIAQSSRPTQKVPIIIRRPNLERKVWLEMAVKNAQLAIAHKIQVDATQSQRLLALQHSMEWDESIQRLECFDISHTQGEAAVASCVVFDEGYMQPKQYRRFNVSPAQGGDDYAAMHEALSRRAQRILSGEVPYPDVWIIDGGLGQLGVAKKIVDDYGLTMKVMSISKGEARTAGLETLWFAEQTEPLTLPPHHPGLHLLQHIRDEAHRFAIQGHRARRGKARTQSMLDEIPGIGAKRKKALLQHFGGVKTLEGASIQDIASVQGISMQLAETLYAWLHETKN
jgi:excinuclease ABC subunit C